MRFTINASAPTVSGLFCISEERFTFLSEGMAKIIMNSVKETIAQVMELSGEKIVAACLEAIEKREGMLNFKMQHQLDIMSQTLISLVKWVDEQDLPYDEACAVFYMLGENSTSIRGHFDRTLSERVNLFMGEFMKKSTPDSKMVDFVAIVKNKKNENMIEAIELLHGLNKILDSIKTDVTGKAGSDSDIDKPSTKPVQSKEDLVENQVESKL